MKFVPLLGIDSGFSTWLSSSALGFLPDNSPKILGTDLYMTDGKTGKEVSQPDLHSR